MRVQVKFFAIFREMLGVKSEAKEIADGTTVEQLWQDYASRSPRAANARAAYAVNQKLVKPDYVLRDGDEVGFLPPVSGGAKTSERESARKGRKPRKKGAPVMLSGAKHLDKNSRTRKSKLDSSLPLVAQNDRPSRDSRMNKDALITRKTLDLNALYSRVAFPGAGAIIVFSGVVRDNSRGKSVKHLEYEAYPQMAEQSMRDIIAEIHERWAEARVAIAHRIGKIKIGESSLLIAVAAPHRPEAYAASRYAIERIKAILPVWKKEFATDGAEWMEGPIAGELPPEKADAIVQQAEENKTQVS